MIYLYRKNKAYERILRPSKHYRCSIKNQVSEVNMYFVGKQYENILN